MSDLELELVEMELFGERYILDHPYINDGIKHIVVKDNSKVYVRTEDGQFVEAENAD